MSDSPEYRSAPPRSIPEFSSASYRSVYQSMQNDAEALAINITNGDANYIDAVKPLVIGQSYIGWKMETDPAIIPWDKRIWGQVLKTGEPDVAVANRVVETVLDYCTRTDTVENIDERSELLRKLETELIDDANYSWKINPATRQDTFYRLQFMREVITRVTSTDAQSAAQPEVVKARAIAQNLRYMQGELSQFLTAKKPSLKDA